MSMPLLDKAKSIWERKNIMNISKKRLEELNNLRDEDINYSDIPELTNYFWSKTNLDLPKKKFSKSSSR